MMLRTRLALAFALFAAVPLAAALWPVSHALSGALSTEHAARLDGAARALDGELARLAREAGTAVDELARSADAEALARELGTGALAPADAAPRAREWMEARGLDVLAVAEPDGRVVSSGHLPGRAGDVDAEVAALLATPPSRAAPHRVMRAGPDGVEPVLALVAWAPVPGDPLRVAGGLALGPERAARLAALTGGAIAIRAPDGALLADAAAPGSPASGGAPDLADRLSARLGALGTPVRSLALGPPDAPVATVEVRLASAGLARARLVVVATFLAALVAGVLAAAAVGAFLASRVTRPVEALRAAALRVAAGDLGARVEARATGEVAELVRAFNAMTADLAASRARLAQAERVAAWREVARRLAHEIKNPLTPIAMSVETLRDAHARARPDFGEIFDEGTRAIGEEVRRLKRIVDEFSRFARLPAPERTPVAPDELVQSVLALFPSAPAGVVVAREVEAGLPAVLADRDQVVQVLLNLVRNALDAMPGGGTLRVAARGEGSAVAFSVSDTGPGVRPEDRPRVFEPYFTTKEGGTGLGLAIAQRIAEEHGGTLELRSAPGEGATFTLTLPAVS
ncbi:HAMP domain-containing sensor histidine kinase [Anaeromyxobacter sp. Fw109-5]|uniref:sensor histidine kinase n=1 Tax=Anaeromyxobacter sp. (strain Fw109-5) TaxID=404589 RepID=UPI000158A589|nr:HAMP domain-containing sensor histidine kinase [Anaeromyxobacter sp. Fw109-5]ABS27592.1 histidine kinase [Anaeromyxobacter sp. Fw109-5]